MNDGAQKLKALGLTQAVIATELDTDQGTVSRWIDGTRKPSSTFRAKIEDKWKHITWRLWDEDIEEASATGTDGAA